MSNTMNGARILMECLGREGVEVIFGYPGGVTLPLYDVMYDHEIRHVLARHEENACFAASGYARSTGKVGVCCATSGPGATNLTTALMDCMMDSIPVVALTGQVTSKLIGSDAFQEADTFGITRSATKHNYLVKDVKDLATVVHEAFHIASTGRPGPVLIDITKDVLQGQAHYAPVSEIHLPGYKVVTDGHAGQIRRAAQMMWEAKKPFIYAGGGIVASGAHEELRAVAETLDAPVVCTLMGLGALPGSHPNYISMPGMHGSYASNMGLSECDLLIALGVRFDDRVTGKLSAFAPHAKVIHVDIDPAEIGKNRTPDLPIVGDAKRVLAKLGRLLKELEPTMAAAHASDRRAWWRQVRDWMAEHPIEPVFAADEIKPQHLMYEIDKLAGGRSIVVTDVGQHQMWSAQYIHFDAPRLWLSSGGLGTMGFGLPASIGAQIANPDQTVFCICGDGGFQMALQELATLANQQLPVKVIIMNNGYLGMVRQWQDMFYHNRLSSVQIEAFPNIELLGAAYGIKGRIVERPSELTDALREAVEHPGPYLLDVHVSNFENVYPMVPAGAASHEMVLAPPKPVPVASN
jgi:acetolactate synthase-1/2/3 large subunit